MLPQSMNADDIFASGKFFTGCNYWAGHAGMMMWRDWRPDLVELEFEALAANGLRVLRVFPLWPDFQPLERLAGGSGVTKGWAQRGGPLQNDACLDEEMVRRFRFLCDEADALGLRLVVGLVTGWMSGRVFVPPAFDGVNVLSDPDAIEWQVRFVRRFVRETRDCRAIAAWDLGNECNCLWSNPDGTWRPPSRAVAWVWMNAIVSAIRLEDGLRPVVSGMHSCSSDRLRPWSLHDQGELVDVVTTHPYPLFTPHCNHGPFDSFVNALHPVAESLLYEGVSRRPCLVEEAGCLGPNIASDARAAWTLGKGALASRAYGLRGYLWWCAFDQDHLDFPPYDWVALERELGLLRPDRSPKEHGLSLRRAAEEIAALDDLPPRRIDATCLVSECEDAWPQSFGAFLLAVQAGLSIDFASAEEPLPKASAFILPSGVSPETYTGGAMRRLMNAVREGASLLVSYGDGMMLSRFEELTGCRVESSCASSWETRVAVGDRVVALSGRRRTVISAVRAQVLLRDGDGNPFVTACDLGRGRVVFVNCALERFAVERVDCFDPARLNPAYLIYAAAADALGVARADPAKPPFVSLTVHGERQVSIDLERQP